MRWFWGLLLIAIGILYLGAQFSWWGDLSAAALWRFWPLLLIIFGISIMVKHLRSGWIIILLAFIASLGFVYYSVKFIEIPDQEIVSEEKMSFSEDLGQGVKKGIISIKTGAVNLDVKQSENKFIEGSLNSNVARPQLKVKKDDSSLVAELKTDKSQNINIFSGKLKNNLDVAISNKLPLELTIDAGASSQNLDLSDIILSKLNIDAGASSLRLNLGDKNQENAEVDINAGASSIDIKIPRNLGVKLQLKGGLSDKQFSGFRKISDSEYQTDEYDKAAKHIQINIDAGVSAIKISQY